MTAPAASLPRLRVTHVISGLGDGGAEAVLYRVLTSDPGNDHAVISLTDAGRYGPLLQAAGIGVQVLGMRRGRGTFAGWRRLLRLLRASRPDVVQTWMYHADLLGGLAARWTGTGAVVWGVHSATLDARATKVVAAVCALASHVIPRRIIFVSREAARLHRGRGYASGRITVIPNGYDTEALRPDAAARERLRREWLLPPATIALGMVARWDVLKDHANLAAALSRLAGDKAADWKLVLVGQGIDDANVELLRLLEGAGVRERTLLLGSRPDIAAVMSALDLHVLSSRAEAFPNVVAEAMSCGTPCVVTDVGDAAYIVGETGWVVPPRDPEALAGALHAAIEAMRDAEGRASRQLAARARVETEFGLAGVVRRYAEVWRAVASR